MAVPHVDGGAHDDLPIRDFDSSGLGWLLVETRSSMDQCLLLLGTLDDGPAAWLRTGEALERIWLELTRRGYAASYSRRSSGWPAPTNCCAWSLSSVCIRTYYCGSAVRRSRPHPAAAPPLRTC
jgi:hypothetical protein